MRTSSRFGRLVAIGLLVWHLPACSASAGWRTQTIVPQETKRTVYAGDVRVTTADDTVHAFRGLWVSADSLGGWLTEPAGTERAFPLSDVTAVQVWHQGGAPSHETSRVSATAKIVSVVALAALVGCVWFYNKYH